MPVNNIDPVVDQREQTFNQGHVGPTEFISTKIENIGLIRTIMFDVDFKLINPNGPFQKRNLSPKAYYEKYVSPWLSHHSVLSKAEVRCTGGGYHVLLNLDTPIRLATDEQRKRWQGIVQVIQMVLPIDPQQPGINAMTRPVGSINGKNSKTVTCLRQGSAVTENEIFSLYVSMKDRPFATLMQIWFGAEKVVPCPLCCGEGTYLEVVGPRTGRCYGDCGKVKINDLFQKALKITKSKGK